MIHFEPCKVQHFDYIIPLSVQSDEYRRLWTAGYLDALLAGLALSAWASGTCLGAAGVISPPAWGSRGEAWSMLTGVAAPHLLPIVRKIRHVVSQLPYERIDMLVADGNENGHSLARLCGFAYEARLEKYHPSGRDAHMYKRIRH